MKPQYIVIAVVAFLVIGALYLFIYAGNSSAPESQNDTVTVGNITLSGAWVAETIGAQPQTAAYLTVQNTGSTEERLVEASSPAAAMVNLHQTVTENNVSRMEAVDAVIVPADGEVSFAPGGLHIMMTGLSGPLNAGDTVSLTLSFLEAGDVTIVAPVRARADMMNSDSGTGS